ncbi:MAG TPA: alanine--tRNA ligase, partial [Burkholderiales bacterium]|nr:alanine--tRNA ligase [Burkholderiales bacterium]
MNQFKDVFLGIEKRDYSRATTAQKCVRAGGKHNDLENVGHTRRHHTFFEMMGNFSFGDYFKADAIDFAWDLVTNVYGIPKDRLYVTVFREDDEAEQLWQRVAGVPKDRIFRLDEKDNFWQMGETGPCGPCSEIHYDLGLEAAEPGREGEEFPEDGGGRFVEIWNLVFMQFDRDAAGKLSPLPRPSIDTGLGLERVAAILQGKLSNYDCDLLLPIVEAAGLIFGKPYGSGPRSDTVLRICADHARAAAFLIHDGVVPSNEGRGYVLRKIMRRALRNARMIGVQEMFLYKLTGFVAELMKPAYPELMESVQRVARIVKDEEQRYTSTFQVAERMFHDEAKSAAGGVLPGAAAFKLYDTYGMALDEQEEMARELGLRIDGAGFEEAMERQRERARASWKGGEKAQIQPVYQELSDRLKTRFIGYDTLRSEATLEALILNGQAVEELAEGVQAEAVIDPTPFYAESGGQVGDVGRFYDETHTRRLAEVLTTYAPVKGLHVCKIRTVAPLVRGARLSVEVDEPLRAATRRNHTATHLLQAALQKVLGKHVKQAGSVVEPARLRFDFTHYAPMSSAERAEVERLVNEEVLKNLPVGVEVMNLDDALHTGAMALFGEKYGEKVRVVSVPGFSRELCGGTHVLRTGDIGLAHIVSEGSISSGVRRIEMLTGPGMLALYDAEKTALMSQLEKAREEQRALEREVEHLKERIAVALVAEVEKQSREIKGARIVATMVDGVDRNQMRNMADQLRNKWKTAVVVLGTPADSGVALIAAVTKDLTSKVHAGKLVGAVA